MRDTPRRAFALLGAVVTIAAGVLSRRIHVGWALWDKSLGDVLYTFLVFFALGVVAPRVDGRVRAGLAFGICLALELFQITGIPLALARAHPWVHWLLGGAFDVADIVCYAIAGVILYAACQARVRRQI